MYILDTDHFRSGFSHGIHLKFQGNYDALSR